MAADLERAEILVNHAGSLSDISILGISRQRPYGSTGRPNALLPSDQWRCETVRPVRELLLLPPLGFDPVFDQFH